MSWKDILKGPKYDAAKAKYDRIRNYVDAAKKEMDAAAAEEGVGMRERLGSPKTPATTPATTPAKPEESSDDIYERMAAPTPDKRYPRKLPKGEHPYDVQESVPDTKIQEESESPFSQEEQEERRKIREKEANLSPEERLQNLRDRRAKPSKFKDFKSKITQKVKEKTAQKEKPKDPLGQRTAKEKDEKTPRWKKVLDRGVKGAKGVYDWGAERRKEISESQSPGSKIEEARHTEQAEGRKERAATSAKQREAAQQAREDRTRAWTDKRLEGIEEYEKETARDKKEGKQRFKDLVAETQEKRTVKPGSAIAEYQQATAQKEKDTKQRMGQVADRYQYEGARDKALAQVEADKTERQTRDKQLARGQSKALQAARKKLGLSRHVGETDAELLQRIKSHGKPKPPQPPQQTGPTDEELQQMYPQSSNPRKTHELIQARKKKVQAPKGPTGPPPNQNREQGQVSSALSETGLDAQRKQKELNEKTEETTQALQNATEELTQVEKMNNDKYNRKQKGEKNRNLTPFIMPQKERPAPKSGSVPGVIQNPKRRQKKTENKW